MRLVGALLLPLSLACSGEAAPDPGVAPEPPPTPRAADPFAALSAATLPTLADQWLVILASHKDPGAAVPALGTVEAHPELGASPVTLLSSRFKNLMPCYAVTAAAATPDKDTALRLSAALTGLGVDNYVKNAGAWVGPSATLDRWCAGELSTAAQGDARILVKGARTLWLPVDAPEAVVANAKAMAAPPVAMSPRYDGWRQPFKSERVGSVAREQRWHVLDAGSGTTFDCAVDAFAVLTLGTPHFGALQDGELKRPACGEPAMYAALTCPEDVGEGPWIATAKATLAGYTRSGDGTPAEVAAAQKAATEGTPWDEPPGGNAEAERTLVVSRWTGAGGDTVVVEARRSVGDGVCGGEETTWVGLFMAAPDGLGAQVGDWLPVSAATAARVVDVGADGTPELLTQGFPAITTLSGAAGALAAQDLAYCDCPC